VSDEFVVDPDLGEQLHEQELQAAEKIAALTAHQVRRRREQNGPPARRGAHAKAHALVTATFTVMENLPAELAQGVFVPGATYPAWIRFSNGSAHVRPDPKGDGRGMAIKLFDVPGRKILAGEADALTQDFLLIATPVFFAADPQRYLTFLRRGASRNPFVRVAALLPLGLKGVVIAVRAGRSHISNPLTTRYWSSVPYRLGDPPHKQAIKFTAIPQEQPGPKTDTAGPNFLRRAMVEHLAERDAVFDFLVQPRTSAAMSVEDPLTEWPEAEAPFHKVATIRIPQQTFATPARDLLAENLSFNPWHSLPQHRPIGGINRTRGVVYRTIADLRRELDGAPLREPTQRIEP
jgi:hypothetical protein